MLDGFHGIAKDVANEFFSDADKAKLSMRSAASSKFEITFRVDSETSVGMLIPVSMFHRTESVHADWRNVFTNLKEKYNQKLEEQQAAKDKQDLEDYAKRQAEARKSDKSE